MAAPNLNLRQDLYTAFLYGTPNVVTWLGLHIGFPFILNQYDVKQKFLERHCMISQKNISEGRFLCLILHAFLHEDANHLISNFIGFIPECYRLINCIDSQNKYRSIKLFWFLYITIAPLSSLLNYQYFNMYKSFLKYYFRNDQRMLNDINIKFDSMNRYSSKMRGLGASGCIAGLDGFNFCISIELIIKRLRQIKELLTMEYDGTQEQIDPDTDSELFQIGEKDLDRDGDEDIIEKKYRYYNIKLGIDCLGLAWSGMFVYLYFKDIHQDWQYRKNERGGRDILINFDQTGIGYRMHLMGSFAGIIMYGIYKWLL